MMLHGPQIRFVYFRVPSWFRFLKPKPRTHTKVHETGQSVIPYCSHLAISVLLMALSGQFLFAQLKSNPVWPHPIPSRTKDNGNKDLFVTVLGDVKTPLADGMFDPAKDELRFNDGTVRADYY